MARSGISLSAGLTTSKGVSLKENRDFKPRLVKDVQIRFFKRDERGEFYIVSLKNRKSYLKVHNVGRDIVEMLDGNTSIADIEEALKRKDVEVDLSKFIKLLGEKGLLEGQQSLEKQSKTKSLVLHHIPLFKRTEPILNKIYSIFHKFFGREVLLFLVLTNLVIFFMFLVTLFTGYIKLGDLFFIGNSVFFAVTVYLLAIMPFLVVTHELAHGIVCFHYGGRPQEMGIALFFFIPFFYVDTSDVWTLGKKQSTMVFLAGPLSTFSIGNFCFLLSFLLPMPYISILRMVAFGSFLIVLNGFNPVAGSDGYYILQTITDFPNLNLHVREYISTWFKRALSLVSKDHYKEYITSYSRQEKRILEIYAPFTFIINAVFIFVMGYWGIFFANDFWKSTLSIVEAFPNIPIARLLIWLVQSIYIVLIVFFLVTTSKKLIQGLWAKENM